MATLEGTGMPDGSIWLSFARMIRRHIEKSTGREPLSFSELINNLKSDYHYNHCLIRLPGT